MNRRALLAALLLIAPIGEALAQPIARIPRVVTLWASSEAVVGPYAREVEAGLEERGWVIGKTVRIEHRFTDAKPERLVLIAAEVAESAPDVIMTGLNPAALALRKLTTTIPIVVGWSVDPVGAGLAQSLARPGGNVTGLTAAPPELSSKRLQIMREILPGLRRVGVLYNSGNSGIRSSYEELKSAASEFGIELIDAPMTGPGDLPAAFERMRSGGAEVVTGLPGDALTFRLRKEINALALHHRMPTNYAARESVEDGALLSYAPSLRATYRRSSMLIDRILRGANPADLPFEQPTRFEVVINLTTARALGLTIPPSLLARADEVIE
jgi:putative tryptophan/tyrosine transport system substrate-binding protein